MEEPNLEESDGFDWDPANRKKVEKRMPTGIAESAFVGEPAVFYDERHSVSEPRWFLMNQVGQQFVFLVFTLRGKRIRIISARFMHDKEVKKYEREIG